MAKEDGRIEPDFLRRSITKQPFKIDKNRKDESMKWYSDNTQIRWACLELIKGREISHADEIAEAKGWRLSAIIYYLRHKYKWPIATRYDDRRIAHYRLSSEVDAEALKKPRSFHQKKKPAGTDSLSDK